MGRNKKEVEKMTDYDFSQCRFINENMQFFTYYDFCDGCKILKKNFKSLNSDAKLFYKWYIYANIHMNETFKNAIWDYLNCDDEVCYITLIELKKIYHTK